MSVSEKTRILSEKKEDYTSTQQNISTSQDQDDDFDAEDDRTMSWIGWLSPGSNYVNSIIGSGILGISFAFYTSGLILGLFVLLLVGILSDISLCLLIKAGEKAKVDSYQGLVEKAMGKFGFYLATFVQFCFPFLGMISYNIIVGDTITTVVIRATGLTSQSVLTSREFIIIMATLLITLPLSLYKHLEKLARSSALSLLMVFFIGVTMVIRITHMHAFDDNLPLSLFEPAGFSKSFGIVAFAYVMHHNSFLVYASMEVSTLKNWSILTHGSIGISFLTMVGYGVVGFLSFRENTQGNILNNFCWDDDLMNVSRIMFAITVLLTYPIECFVCREIIFRLAKKFFGWETDSNMAHVLITVLLVISITFLSFTTECLGIVLTLNGVMIAVPMAFIIPSVSYCLVSEERLLSKASIAPIIVTLFGVFVLLNGTYSIITAEDEGCVSGIVMPYCQAPAAAP